MLLNETIILSAKFFQAFSNLLIEKKIAKRHLLNSMVDGMQEDSCPVNFHLWQIGSQLYAVTIFMI